MKLTRELIIYPGYDKRSDEPGKDYGVHGCDVRFYVHGPRKSKSVQFVLYTDWLPLNVQKERMGRNIHGVTHPEVYQAVISEQPTGADLGYHSPKPMYKGQHKMTCDLNKRGWCYYDGSGLAADGLRNTMLTKGSEGVWEELEQYFHEMFPTPTKESEPTDE